MTPIPEAGLEFDFNYELEEVCSRICRANTETIVPGEVAGFQCIRGIDLAVSVEDLQTLAGDDLVEQRSDDRKNALRAFGIELFTPSEVCERLETKVFIHREDEREICSLWHGPTLFSGGARPYYKNILFTEESVLALGAFLLLPEAQLCQVPKTGLLIAQRSLTTGGIVAKELILMAEGANQILNGTVRGYPSGRLIAIPGISEPGNNLRPDVETKLLGFWEKARQTINPIVLLLRNN